MPTNDRTIRIIKREERETLAGEQEIIASELKTESQTRREIFETVCSWIEEQRQTKAKRVKALHL